ncbi:hypothetical protein B5X24_HaOG215739 [Helicoverpa armigera]|nr:hypothetical protein B5X24_HaOG215739 [Helicoverpa armigera]
MRSYRFQGHDEAVMDVTFSPSGKYMASASRDKTVRLWVPTVTGSTGMFKAHSQTVRSVQFSPDGTKIVTASDDKIVKLWSTEKHKFLSSYVGHTNWVRCARMSGDGSVIASCSDDKSTKLWNLDNGECIHTYKDQKGNGLCLAWHPSGCYIAILDLLEGHPIFTLSGHTGPVNAVSFSGSGESFASAGDDRLVFIWKTNFTELSGDFKENIADNVSSIQKSVSQASKITYTAKDRNQGTKAWYQCYHTHKIPVITFVHLDDVSQGNLSMRMSYSGEPNRMCHSEEPNRMCHSEEPNRMCHSEEPNRMCHSEEPNRMSCLEEPNANSTRIEPQFFSHTEPCLRNNYSVVNESVRMNSTKTTPRNNGPANCSSGDCSQNSVGHISHIPRIPPSPTTYTLPSVLDKSTGSCREGGQDNLFGMIKLRNNDVCYTSGIIEWVGRKRSYPINSGFKLITDQCDTHVEKVRKLNTNFSSGTHEHNSCDCADVLPTVNAIVDHLNALHEAVDLVDLRLNTLEDSMTKKKGGK